MKTFSRHRFLSAVFFAVLALVLTSPLAAETHKMKYSADVPKHPLLHQIWSKLRLGTLRFYDGAPDAKTAEIVYDNLDFMRGVEAFLDGVPAASIYGIAQGYREAGMGPQSIGIFEDLMDARSIFLTANSTTVYCKQGFRFRGRAYCDRDAGWHAGADG